MARSRNKILMIVKLFDSMKIIMKSAASLALLCVLVSCGEKYPEPAPGSEIGFALSFFQNVSAVTESDQNVVVSPYSAGVALSMLAEGSAGQTRAEFDDALNGCLFRAEDIGGEDIVVNSANSIWVSDMFSPKERYTKLLEKEYDAVIASRDFSVKSTVNEINAWCGEHTAEKITHILDELSPNDVMVLINALYFNAPWEKAFDEAATADGIFYGVGADQTVPMMSTKGNFGYAEYQGCQMIRLPYSGGRYSMYVILPPEGLDANTVIPYVSESAYETAMGMLSVQEVRLTMPRFRLETSMILNKPLERMGIHDAFCGAADFSVISSGPLALGTVKQKCYIDVTEKGTEAAAVTSAQIRLTSVRPDRIIQMRVDRPFLFLIADSDSENILFMGKVVEI